MFEKVFGANVDWISQHSVLPDYFRQQFYATGNLFPEFAANIGGGQNIYNFAYYGLYSPLILPSYFLPFIKMSDYIMAVSILCLIADFILFYKWLRGNEVSKGNAALTAVLFLLAGPMIFHSYNQIMFVNYMPFLILSLMGVDRYFKKKKIGLFTVGVFLMILTSFYFSIGGILILVIYGVYRYMDVQEKKKEKVTFGRFFLAGLQFCVPILIGVLMSGVLLVPTAMALMAGVRGNKSAVSTASLFLPDLEVFRVLYQPYGIGLTTLVITVLLTGCMYKKWREKYLHMACIVLIVVPFCMYVLNGGLYIRDKALIPMVPLLCYMIAMYLEKQRKREISFLAGMIPFVLTICFVWFGRMQIEGNGYRHLILMDAILMFFCGLLFYWKRIEKILILVPIGCLVIFGVGYHTEADRMLDASFYKKVTNAEYKKQVEQIFSKETGFYRLEQEGTSSENAADLNRIWSMDQYSSSIYSSTYHAGYQKFRQKVFGVEQPYRNMLMQSQAKNPVFQKLMGVKYILSETEVPGYKKVAEGIYENKDVLPIAYATDQILSEKVYENLKFPYNQTAFLTHAVIKGKADTVSLQEEQAENLEIIQLDLRGDGKASSVQKTENGYEIRTDKTYDLKEEIQEAKEGDILFVQFTVKNHHPSKDVSIWLEGIRNKLTAKQHIYYNENETFTYAVRLKEGQKNVKISFGAGNYGISHVKSYLWKNSTQSEKKEETLCQSSLNIDANRTKGNVIAGSIDVTKKGYLITSIPYEKNFEVRVDGKKVTYKKVNTEFLGFPIEQGTHDIEIVYHAPGVMAGKILTILGVLLFAGTAIVYRCAFIFGEKVV